jgi:Tol biopolymer transport system component
MIGKTLAHYEVSEQIGAGGMGEVYRAHDTKLGRDVALKILPESFAADADRLSRFEREAKLLAGLNHSNIAAIYGIEESDAQRFLVLELVEGLDLSKRLAQGPLIVDDALAIGYQMAEALEAAHEQGVVHRDLKPANVVVSPDGTVKVLDFGLAKALESDANASELSHSPTVLASSPTLQGVILGTAAYMSPEQARGKAVDRRADIWAFGVVLFEMLTARSLFSGETVSDTLASVIKSEPDWNALPDDTPRVIVRLIERCLDKNPRTRLRDIGEARVVIDKVLRGEIKDDDTARATADGGGSSARSPIVWIAAIIVVAVAAALAAWTFKPGTPEPRLRKFGLAVHSEAGSSPAEPVISPDGSKIVYVLGGDLFVHELHELSPRKLDSHGGATMPFWSPDGEFIGYLSDGTLWKIPTSGGTSVRICDPAASFTSGRGAAWTPDDRIIYAHGSSPIYEVSANGGDPRVAVELAEDEADFHDPNLLPGGKGTLFVAHRKNDAPDRLELLANGERTLIVHVEGVRLANPAYSSSGHIVYHRTGSNSGVWAVPFSLSKLEVTGEPFPVASDAALPSVSNDGTLVCLRGATGQQIDLVWIDRNGTVGDPVSEVKPSYFDPEFSPDGKRIAVCEWDGVEVDIWIHDIERKTRTRFTFVEGPQLGPEWTPDGLRVLYYDSRNDTIVSRMADGTGSPTAVGKGREPSISRDGNYLAYHLQGGATQEDLWYTSLDGSQEPKPFLNTRAREMRGRISPDGKYLAYTSDQSGDFDIYLTRFPSGEGKWQVSTNGGNRPRWGRDGDRLYYQESDCDLMEVSVQLEPAVALGTPQRIIDCSELGLNEGFGREFAVFGNGERFMWSKSAVADVERIDVGITVVENWATEFAE